MTTTSVATSWAKFNYDCAINMCAIHIEYDIRIHASKTKKMSSDGVVAKFTVTPVMRMYPIKISARQSSQI